VSTGAAGCRQAPAGLEDAVNTPQGRQRVVQVPDLRQLNDEPAGDDPGAALRAAIAADQADGSAGPRAEGRA